METESGLRLVTVVGNAIQVSNLSDPLGELTRSDGIIAGSCSPGRGRLFLERWLRTDTGPRRCLEEWRVGETGVERIWAVQRDDFQGHFLERKPLCSWQHGDEVYLYAVVKSKVERVCDADGSEVGHHLLHANITAVRGFVYRGRPLLAVGTADTSVQILDAESMQVVHQFAWRGCTLQMPRHAGGGIHDFEYVEGRLYFSVGWNEFDCSTAHYLGRQAIVSWAIGSDDVFEVVDGNGSEPMHALAQVDVDGRAALIWRTASHILTIFVPQTGRLSRFEIDAHIDRSSSVHACHTDDGGRVLIEDEASVCHVCRLSDLRYKNRQQVELSHLSGDDSGSSSSSSAESSEPSVEAQPPQERSLEVQREASSSRSPLIVATALSGLALLALGAYIGGRQLIR